MKVQSVLITLGDEEVESPRYMVHKKLSDGSILSLPVGRKRIPEWVDFDAGMSILVAYIHYLLGRGT